MAEFRSILTPDLVQTATAPDPTNAGALAQARADELRGQSAAITALAAQAASSAQRASQARQRNFRTFLNLDLKAFEVQQQSEAQDLTLESTLRIDQRLQSLLQDPSVNPLQLAQEGERIIEEETNEALQKSGGFDSKLQTFVQSKLENIKLNKIPALRREGYKREGESQVAATNRRNFLRKSELYATGTSEARKIELITDSVTDIEALAGVHISADKANALIQGEIKDFRKNNILALAINNPIDALKAIKIENFSPQEELALTNQVNNILAIEENQRRKQEAQAAKVKQQEQEKLVTEMYGKVVFEQADPRRLLADPAVRSNLSAGQISGLFRFDSMMTSLADKESDEDITDMVNLTTRYGAGTMNPQQIGRDLIAEVENGANINKSGVEKLQALGMKAFREKQSLFRTNFKDEWDAGEDAIKRLLKFEGGFLSVFEKNRKTELTLALNTALKTYRTRMSDLRSQAEQKQVDPLSLARPADIADEILLDAIPLAINALKNQEVSSAAFKNLISPDSLGRSKRELSKDLATQIQSGLITADEAAIVRNALSLSQQFEDLQARMDAVEKTERMKKQREQDIKEKKGSSILDIFKFGGDN